MSFQVGDKIVEIYGNYGGLVLEVSAFFKGIDHPKPIVFFEYGHTVCDDLAGDFRHATPAEIAAGHRIDTQQLEVLEMIDVSPNCGVSEI